MNKRVIIVHGWSGNPKSDWLPWLSEQLEAKGFSVIAPAMPNPDEPEMESWVTTLSEAVGTVDNNTYFVGHSIGCQTILRYLETVSVPVGGAVFVAGWFSLENLEDEDARAIAEPWIETPIDITKVKNVLKKSTLIISDNDPYGAFEENKHKFAELGSRIVILPGAEHICEGDGHTEVPEIETAIEALL